MKSTGIVFPHQLFEDNILISNCSNIYLVEEYLFFRQYNFHKAKIAFHRASMKFYESYLREKGVEVVYIESKNELSDIRKLIPFLKKSGIYQLQYIDTTDNWLEKRIIRNLQSKLNFGSKTPQPAVSEHTRRKCPLFFRSPDFLSNRFLQTSAHQ